MKMSKIHSPVLLIIAIVLILSGCTSPATTQAPTVTPKPAPPVTVTVTATATSTPSITPSSTPQPTATPTATPPPPPTPTPTPQANPVPPEVAQYAADWPLPNKDYANSRATKDSTINSSNINTLGVAWAFPLPGTGGSGSASTMPIVMGNTVYMQDMSRNVFAIDRATGKAKWVHMYNDNDVGPNGVSVGYGKVFFASNAYTMTALDANTGNEVWKNKVSSTNTIGIDIQPTVYNGIVYTSTVPAAVPGVNNFYRGNAYGTFMGLDQVTGKSLWKWDTVDDPKTMWGHPEVNSGGGTWYPPAIDTKTGMSFWGVANPAPYPGTAQYPNGSSRPGPNLYTDALVALTPAGQLSWYNQVLPHDISDYDLQISPMLGAANYGGKTQDIVIAAGKMGRVYAINRTSGALIWEMEIGKHQNDLFVQHPQGTTTTFPGIYGGVETPMAYADGVVYVACNNLASDFTPSSQTIAPFSTATSDFVAIDVNLGKLLWDVPLPSAGFGAATVVNDLVLTATFDGTMYAFKRDTGAQVWTYKAPGGVNAWPSIAGDTIFWPVGVSGTPALIAFKLGASSPVLTIGRPNNNSNIPAGDINVNAVGLNIKIVDKIGQANVSGEGHYVYYQDITPPTTPGQNAAVQGAIASIQTSQTWKSVTGGTHTFSVQLVNNDNTPLSPAVVTSVTVNAVVKPPDISITAPANNATVPVGPVMIQTKVNNFTLSDQPGINQGKVIYYIDSEIPRELGKPATASNSVTSTADSNTWQMPPGTHTFGVQLVNSDLTPLNPPVYAAIVVSNSEVPGPGGP